MTKKITYHLLIALTILVIVINCNFVTAEPFIGEDDVYTKNIELGASEKFYWTIYKNTSKNYGISVKLNGLNGWSWEVTPTNFVLSEDNAYEIVTLTVGVPQFPEEEQGKASVIFTYRELNSTQKYNIVKEVTVNIIGFSYGGEANTIIGGFSNPLPYPLDNLYGAFLLNIIIWFVIASIVYLFIKYIIHSLVKKTKTQLDDAIIMIIRTPILLMILLYGIITSVIRMNIQIGIRETLYQIFNFIVLGILIYVIYKIYDEFLDEITIRRGGKSSSFGRVLRPIFKILGTVVIIIGGLIYGLSIVGVNVTALLAGAGVFGLVIAFAAQDTLSNFFSGVHLLLDRPFRIGDLILLESGEYCRVENVGMRSTKLYSIFDHELIILPNNTMASQKIINIVKPDTKIRQKIEVGVAYGSNVEKVKAILYEAAANHPDILTDKDQEPLVRFTGFGDSSLDFLLIITINDVMKQWKVRSDVITTIDRRFREEKITIPFPQRTVWFNMIKENDKLNDNMLKDNHK